MQPDEKAPENQATRTFPCPSCGADMRYDAAHGGLVCDYCGGAKAVDTATAPKITEHTDFNEATAARRWQGEKQVACETCGAVWVLATHDAAGNCPYCGASHVAEVDEAMVAPDAVLPFAVTEKQAGEQLKKWLKGRWFAPGALKREAQAGHWRGVYCPHWTYDANTTSQYAGLVGHHYFVPVTRTRVVNGKTETYTEQEMRTRWVPTSGALRLDFDDLLVRAFRFEEKAAAPNNFSLAALKPYTPEFLSGFVVKRYEVGLKEGYEQAKQIMDSRIRDGIRQQAGGDEWMLQSLSTDISGASYKLVLLPLWGNHYKYRGKPYDVWVNGQNGTLSGKAPVSAVKVAALVLAIAAVAAGIWYFFVRDEAGDFTAPNIGWEDSAPAPYRNYYEW